MTRELVRRVLDRRQELRSHFQPIQDLKRGIVAGYEALLRLPEDIGVTTEELFGAAVGTDVLADLEVLAIDQHLASAHDLPAGRLFLNLSAPAFHDARVRAGSLARKVRAAGLVPERVVLELTEIVRLPDPARFALELTPLRQEGFSIALDDFGAGFSSLRLLVELGPDFVKIDKTLVTGAARHKRRRVFLDSIGTLGRRINCAAIAEGVERTQQALQTFAGRVPALYDEADRQAGGIDSTDRQGARRRYPMLSMSIGLVTWSGEAGVDYRQLVQIAAEVKTEAKRITGPAAVLNRRSLVPYSQAVFPFGSPRSGSE